MAYFTADQNYPNADPREPVFPNYRDFRRNWFAAALVAMLLWYAIPTAVLVGLGVWAWREPTTSPALLFLALAAIGVAAAWWDRE